jgi:hypothetical protein
MLLHLKAVLAHEFGHFAQRTMAVGRWVYIAQQIAAHIVAKRDALDKLLHTISRWDIRIAWVGWIFRPTSSNDRGCYSPACGVSRDAARVPRLCCRPT